MTLTTKHSYHLRMKRPKKGAYWLGEESDSESESEQWDEDKRSADENEDKRPKSSPIKAIVHRSGTRTRKHTDPDADPEILQMSPEEERFYLSMSPEDKSRMIQQWNHLKTPTGSTDAPFRFRVISLPSSVMSDATKRILLQRYESFQMMNPDHGEYSKYEKWFDTVQRIPFGVYHRFPTATPASIGEHLIRLRHHLDASVAEHDATKNQLMLLLAQWLTNPEAKGKCIGIQGPAGIGKTTLIKKGVSETLGIPFGFIPLGGAGDAGFLEGHAFTYEGGTYGRIVELLIKLRVMNPVLFFDELDKIADSSKGDEVSAILVHLTDQSQNHHFTDKYLGDIELDVSRCLMVFTFNDESKIHPILKDRLHVLRLEGYTASQKIHIARHHLLPNILAEFKWSPTDIVMPDMVLWYILSQIPEESGVRHFKRALETVLGWVNMARFVIVPPLTEYVLFPFELKESLVGAFLSP